MTLPDTREMFRTLIGEPSVSCTEVARDQSNLRVVHHLAGWLEDLGFAVDVLTLPTDAGKANLIATLGAPPDADAPPSGLVLSGHTDTVPYDDSLWSRDPLALTESDDRLYGLGTCDMKGFFPIALDAAARFAGRDLAQPLTIVATSDEESSMAGARHLEAIGRPRARAAVIGEPTGLQPVHAHKGIMLMSIHLTGRSGHSSNPARGNSALDAMHAVMGELIAFRGELADLYRNPAFEVAVPTLNLGCLHAGDSPNRICETARLQIDLRSLPGMDHDRICADMTGRLETVSAHHGTAIEVSRLSPTLPPYETPRDGELIGYLERLSGKTAGTVAFGTEAPFLRALGMETAVFGPGSIDQAHQPDENLDKAFIEPATDALSALIERYCCRVA